jgi:YegS/Rv2252/BmrU family lipid kinase
MEQARDLARGAGLSPDEVTIVATERPGHAAQLSRAFADLAVDRILVWGGDGTINEAAGPLIGSGVALGIIPGGSGDGLAHSLGLPRDVGAAVRAALTGPPCAVDVGYFAGRHFLNVAGAGFDAAVAARFNRRRTRGVRGYIAECLSAVWSYRCDQYDLRTSGGQWTGPRFLVAFANGREYGNGLVLVQNASPTDGQLDMVVVDDGPALAQFWRARRLTWRRLAPAAGVHRARITGATLRGERLSCHVDGEPFEASGTIEVRLVPGALRVAGASG